MMTFLFSTEKIHMINIYLCFKIAKVKNAIVNHLKCKNELSLIFQMLLIKNILKFLRNKQVFIIRHIRTHIFQIIVYMHIFIQGSKFSSKPWNSYWQSISIGLYACSNFSQEFRSSGWQPWLFPSSKTIQLCEANSNVDGLVINFLREGMW
jgi:hypothetical protein